MQKAHRHPQKSIYTVQNLFTLIIMQFLESSDFERMPFPLEQLCSPSHSHILEAGLRDYLPTVRWFMSKSRPITRVVLLEAIPLHSPEATRCGSLCIIEVQFSQGPAKLYALPLHFAEGEKMRTVLQQYPSQVVWTARTPQADTPSSILYDPMIDAAFCISLVEHLAHESRIQGRSGSLVPHLQHSSLDTASLATPQLTGLEQSNSSVIFPGQYFLKLYRKLEEGIHPEPEMCLFLEASQKFTQAPNITGTWDYESDHKSYTLGILQEFVPSQTNAWPLVGTLIERFVNEDTANNAQLPRLAKQLGQRTAEMHLALAASHNNRAFCPRPFSPFYLRSLFQSARQRLQRVQQQIEMAIAPVDSPIRKLATPFLHSVPALHTKIGSLLAIHDTGMRIRIHGDFHLGQILYNNEDFIFVDFEGEPARSLSERRQKRSALCDVAGLLRSFSYAAEYFIKQRPGLRPDGPECGLARSVAQRLSAEFLESYFARMDTSPLLPRQPSSRIELLKFFLLEKALYEIEYEMENRPDWVSIPLRGIQELLGQSL